MPAMRLTLGLVAALGLLARPSEAVTPVEKVVELLESLSKKIEEEGKAEAAAYDKYACFCKEQVDDKTYAIEKSDAKIAKLDSEIEKLGAEITVLEGEIAELATKISDKQAESKTAQEARDLEHADYVTKEADAAGAIDACERATQALKDSKSSMGGKTELEAALVQVRSLASTALALSAATGRGSLSNQKMAELAKLSQPGAAYEYKYHSNAIITTIEELKESFTKIKADLDEVEFGQHTLHDKKQLGLANEIKFAEKERDEKAALAEAKTEEKNAKDADRTEEKKDRKSDQDFMAVLTDECTAKATLWDQRSSTRSQELTAISDAMTALKDGVAPNWQANKKLVGIQKHQEVTHGHWVYVQEDGRPASFLQVRRGSASAEKNTAVKVKQLLIEASQRLHSPVLSAMALKVIVSEDHFVKVRSIIKDLLQRLDDEAAAEASQKSFCDTAMSEAITKRDEEQGKVEDAKAKISQAESKIAQLKQDIADLSAAIAENIKALKEATDLREQENIENEKTIADAGAGKQAVEMALSVLKNFYTNNAFVQKRSGYVPPNSDREGLTVSDRAPEVFDAEYKGSQDSSKGIIGMLEVILSDFDRTVATVTQEESDALQAFTDFKTTNEADTATKEGLVTTKEGEVTTTEDALIGFQDDLKTASESHDDANKELEKLTSMCVEGEETYEERVAKRKQEIEALKEAHDILENWQK